MNKIYAGLLALLLAGCASKAPMAYDPVPPPSDPAALIERVIAEQPAKFRPENVQAGPDYVEYGMGTISRGSGIGVLSPGGLIAGDNVTRTKSNNTRLYYASVAENRLYNRGRWWIVQSRSKGGSLLAYVYVDNKDTALEYIAALVAMKARQQAK